MMCVAAEGTSGTELAATLRELAGIDGGATQ